MSSLAELPRNDPGRRKYFGNGLWYPYAGVASTPSPPSELPSPFPSSSVESVGVKDKEGAELGIDDGNDVGLSDGVIEGSEVGTSDGVIEGANVGESVGGFGVGSGVGSTKDDRGTHPHR